jgi:hypothetical protein
MLRQCLAVLVGLGLASGASAATWAEGLFEELSHDFGPTPRGPVLVHHYRLTNNTQSAVHVSNVRVSCGCTQATVMHGTLEPGQATSVMATMDSRRFVGPKTVTIFVQFDQPRWEEVRLSISANGRDDLSFSPDSLAFGPIARGTAPVAKTTVTLVGGGWQVTGVTAETSYVRTSFQETRRTGSEVAYELAAQLRPDTPVGTWYTDVWLTTSNPSSPRVRVPLTVEVRPALSLSPGPVLALGQVKAGTPSERKVIVRGSQPFRITGIEGTDAVLAAQSSTTDPRPVHVLTVTVTPEAAGELARSLRIHTDLPADGDADLAVRANVVK